MYSKNIIINIRILVKKNSWIYRLCAFIINLSKYILGGKTKASLWAEAVDSGVLEEVLATLNKLFFTNTKDGSQMLRY